MKINSFDENEFVLKLVHSRAPSLKQIWIGLKWNPKYNNFIQSDYSIPFYKFWAPGEPNGKSRGPCSNMWIAHSTNLPYRATGYWNDLIFAESTRFILVDLSVRSWHSREQNLIAAQDKSLN